MNREGVGEVHAYLHYHFRHRGCARERVEGRGVGRIDSRNDRGVWEALIRSVRLGRAI